MELIDEPRARGRKTAPKFTVTELSRVRLNRVDRGEILAMCGFRGEVGRVSRPRSGHIYLDLKDDSSGYFRP